MNIVNGISVRLLNNDRSNTRRHGARRERINEEDEVENRGFQKKAERSIRWKGEEKKNHKVKLRTNQEEREKNHEEFFRKRWKSKKRESFVKKHQWRKQGTWIVTNSLMKKREKTDTILVI